MQLEKKMSLLDRFRALRETQFGAFVPVLLALLAIWSYFGFALPLYDTLSGQAETFSAIFLSPRNIYNLFMQSAVIATLAVGITIVLLLGEIDLSAAATAGVCAALLGVLVLGGVPGWLACIIVMIVGTIMGAAQGMLIAYVGIPSFVVTLAGLLGYQGLMQKILPTGNLNVSDPFVRSFASVLIPDFWGLVLGLAVVGLFAYAVLRKHARRKALGLEMDTPYSVWGQIAAFGVIVLAAILTLNAYRSIPLLLVLLVAITGLLGWVTTSTPYGRSLFAVGGNAESARRVGMKVKRIRVSAFAIVGLMAAIGGIFGASRYASVSYTAFAGGSLLLEAIGAAVIGGTSLFGGRGSVWNAILGALVIGSLGNGLDLTGASAADKLMVSGAILLLAVAIDAVSRNNVGGR
ncbi:MULTISPECIES: sugar ABC transporter permease [unclassified Shinella]|uniref:sugar ABC transporter permease n=1 Tax=unclassified Shinella TaxID=2643062 RepID=UPI00234F8D29|nr:MULTISPECIES: ABC transporter permease [unclassified Shinella]MCO5154024.1 ABC transporter permease [Shinella sp.]MDC7266944.1 ABC transporter permease [Shinella sp. HY16]MDC7273841.1 ABC transporter permease [Shinella sp. YZ44]